MKIEKKPLKAYRRVPTLTNVCDVGMRSRCPSAQAQSRTKLIPVRMLSRVSRSPVEGEDQWFSRKMELNVSEDP